MEHLLEWLARLDPKYALVLGINGTAITVALLGMWKHWLLSKGATYLRRVYWLTIVMGVINLAVNTLIVVRDPSVWGILGFQIVIIWSIVMAVKGLMYGVPRLPLSDS